MTEIGPDCGSYLFPLSFRTDVRNLQLRDAFGMDDLDDLGAAQFFCRSPSLISAAFSVLT
jgi:hypothetical protein